MNLLSFPLLQFQVTQDIYKIVFRQTTYNVKAFLMNEMKGVAHKTFNILVYLKQYFKNTVRKCVLLSILPWSPSETNIAWSHHNTGDIDSNSAVQHRNRFHFLCSPSWNTIVLSTYNILYSQIEFAIMYYHFTSYYTRATCIHKTCCKFIGIQNSTPHE